MNHRESELQTACVKYFDYQYPKLRQLFFAIPNGVAGDIIQGNIRKGEGTRAGVADMFLSVSQPYNPPNTKGAFGLYIEFKTKVGKQSDAQVLFQHQVKSHGYRYEIIRSFDDFKKLIDDYLK